MSIFIHASSAAGAGLTLALCCETMGHLDDPELTADEVKVIGIAGRIGATECGEQLNDETTIQIVKEYMAWWQQDHIDVENVANTLVAAAGTLKTAWKTGHAGHVRFLKAILVLGHVDGCVSDVEAALPATVAGHIGAEQAAFDQALQELGL